MLNLKRDIYNNRKINRKKLETKIKFETSVESLLEDYENALESIDELQFELGQIYDLSLEANTNHLRTMMQDRSFLNGLAFSNDLLFQSIIKLANKEKALRINPKAQLTAVKYLSRIIAKTSPLSTFTNVALCLCSDEKQEVVISVSREGTFSKVRINSRILAVFLFAIKINLPAFGRISLHLNPTLLIKDLDICFFVNKNNREIFQRVQKNAIILELIHKLNDGAVTYNDLKNYLVDRTDASVSEIQKYIDSLVGAGMIEINIGVSAMNPNWIHGLSDSLFTGDSSLEPLNQLVGFLKSIDKQFTSGDHIARNKLLKQIEENIHAAISQLPGGKEHIEMLLKNFSSTQFRNWVYEDSFVTGKIQIEKERLEEFVKPLDLLLKSISTVFYRKDLYLQMFDFYKNKYSTARIDVLEFYESFYREVKVPEKEWLRVNEGKTNNNPFVSSSMLDQQAAVNKWASRFENAMQTMIPVNDEFNFDLNLLNEVGGLNQSQYPTNSFGAFVQFCLKKDQTEIIGVVNSTLSGYGKMIGRFLHLFDDEVSAEMRSWNLQCQPETAYFAEASDGSFHTGNIHPLLLEKEISLPGSQNLSSGKSIIPITSVSIGMSKAGEFGLFIKDSDQRVFVFDLGFQGVGRSELYKLLIQFNIYSFPNHHLLTSVIQKSKSRLFKTDKLSFIIQPRIVFERHIILCRKKWIISKKYLPVKAESESNPSYFLRINQWRLELGLPVEVFIRLSSKGSTNKLEGNLKEIDYKPQYIDFNSPLFVNLFSRLITRIGETVSIEEMLPGSADLLSEKSSKRTSEFLLQWQS